MVRREKLSLLLLQLWADVHTCTSVHVRYVQHKVGVGVTDKGSAGLSLSLCFNLHITVQEQ